MLGPEALLVDGERAAIERLGLGQPVGVPQQLGQVVEADGDVGMLGPEALLVDGERAAIERLGLGQTVGGPQQLGQVAHSRGVFGMVFAMPHLHGLGIAQCQRDRLGVLTRVVERGDPIVERVQLRIGLRPRRSRGVHCNGQQHRHEQNHQTKPQRPHRGPIAWLYGQPGASEQEG